MRLLALETKALNVSSVMVLSVDEGRAAHAHPQRAAVDVVRGVLQHLAGEHGVPVGTPGNMEQRSLKACHARSPSAGPSRMGGGVRDMALKALQHTSHSSQCCEPC